MARRTGRIRTAGIFRVVAAAARAGRDREGAGAVVMGAMLITLSGFAAISIDLGMLLQARAALQATADASALAGAMVLPDTSTAVAEARSYAALNQPGRGEVLDSSDVVPGNWNPVTGVFTPRGTPIDAVRITTRRSAVNGNAIPLFFGNILGHRTAAVSAMATAWSQGFNGTACIYQLDPSAKPGFEISSNSHVEASCGVVVNSTMGPSQGCESLVMGSGSSLTASGASIVVASSCTKISGSTISPAPVLNYNQTPDPLAAIPPPEVGGCNHTDRKVDSGTVTLNPGVYCKGLIITGSTTRVTLNPGTYIMRGGGFNVESGATATGDGVLVYNTCNLSGGCTTANQSDAKPIQIHSGTKVTMTAPAAGRQRGILFFVDRQMENKGDNRIASDAHSMFDGALYFPTPQFLQIHSNSSTYEKDRMLVIAGRLAVTSGARLGFNRYPTRIPASFGRYALVE